MKKIVGLLLVFATLFTFAACENTPQTSSVEDEPTEEELAELAAADRLGIQYIATGHHARVETDADGVSHLLPAADAASDESAALAALPQETLARLILPLGDFSPDELSDLAEEPQF